MNVPGNLKTRQGGVHSWSIRFALLGMAILLTDCRHEACGDQAEHDTFDSTGSAEKEPAAGEIPVFDAASASPWTSIPELAQPLTTIPDRWRPRSQVRRMYTTGELVSLVEDAFSDRPVSRQQAAIIFPVVDQGHAIHRSGSGLSLLAAYAATYSLGECPAPTPWSIQRILSAARCWSPGVVVDRDTIHLCLQASDAETYVIPSLRERLDSPGQLELTVTIHTSDGQEQEQTTQHRLASSQLLRVPALIARDLLDHVGAAPSDEGMGVLTTPQLQAPADAMFLTELITDVQPSDDESIVAFLAQNPGCVPAWELYLRTTDQPSVALTRLEMVDPALDSPALDIAAASRFSEIGRPEEGFTGLLELARVFAGDPCYHEALLRCAAGMNDEELVVKLFDIWRSVDSSYTGCLGRGEALLNWATLAEGDEGADVPPQRAEYLRGAKSELERAIERNASDWIAHSRLLVVADRLDLPPDFVDQHFAAATERRPRYRDAHVGKLEYLRRRHNRHPEQFLAFTRACIETNFWRQRVPQAVLEAVHRACFNTENHAMRYSALKSRELWEATKLYYQGVQASSVSSTEKAAAAKQFALWGAYGGHFVDVFDVFDAFWALDTDFREGRAVDDILGPSSNYGYVADLLDAGAGYGNFKHVAAAAIALSLGELDKVEPRLERLRRGPAETDGRVAVWGRGHVEHVDNLRTALAQAQRLNKERAVQYSPEELRNLLVVADAEGFGFHNSWEPKDDRFVWMVKHVMAEDTVLPFGIRHGVISGVLEFTMGLTSVDVIAHTRAPRDRITMAYDLQLGIVRLERNGRTLAEAELRAGPQRFRLEYGSEADFLQPCDGVVWHAAVVDDVPSGFGLRIVADPWQPVGRVALSELRIELRD